MPWPDAAEGVEAVPVGLVQIVDDEHETADVRGERGEEALHGQLQPVADVLGVARLLVVAGPALDHRLPSRGEVDEEIGPAGDRLDDVIDHGG